MPAGKGEALICFLLQFIQSIFIAVFDKFDHAVVEGEVVRAMMVSRLTNLCSGVSGVRESTAQAYAALLNANITPIVHEFGSLGCSGDLAPLAHVALALMGEGDVRDAGGARRLAKDALADAGLAPVELAEKEASL